MLFFLLLGQDKGFPSLFSTGFFDVDVTLSLHSDGVADMYLTSKGRGKQMTLKKMFEEMLA